MQLLWKYGVKLQIILRYSKTFLIVNVLKENRYSTLLYNTYKTNNKAGKILTRIKSWETRLSA